MQPWPDDFYGTIIKVSVDGDRVYLTMGGPGWGKTTWTDDPVFIAKLLSDAQVKTPEELDGKPVWANISDGHMYDYAVVKQRL